MLSGMDAPSSTRRPREPKRSRRPQRSILDPVLVMGRNDSTRLEVRVVYKEI